MAEPLPEAVTPEAKPRAQKSESVMEGVYFGETEKAFRTSTYYPDSYKRPYNPDPLVEKDYTYGLYEDMLDDDQVDVALQIKKDLVVGSGWRILHEDDDVQKELDALLNDETERPLSEMLLDLIQAYEYGFSISEKLFKTLPDGRLALKNIKPRHPSTWLLHTDDHGNMTRYEQRGPQGSIDIEPMSIIHYINNEKFQNPYGRSDLRSAHTAWVTKRHITRYYSIFLENAAGPKPVGKYDRRAPQGVVDDIFNAIKSFQTKTALVIPKEFEIEFLEAKNSGEAYIKGINLFNMFIGRALFIPDLLGFSGGETGGGSFSLGKEQIGLFYKHIFRRREILERIVDQHILRPICLYNYGMMEEFPKFKFNPLSDEDAVKQAELWIKGVQGAGWNPTPEEVNHFRSLVKFPESDDVQMKAELMAELNPPPDGGGKFGGKPDEESEGEGDEKEEKEEKETPEKKEFRLKLDTLPGNYKAKTNFKLADQTLKGAVEKIKAETKPIIEDMLEDLYDQVQKKKIIEKKDLDRAESLQLKGLKRLQLVFKKHFRRLHDDAMAQAKTEVSKSTFAKPASNLPNEEFLDFLESETYKYIGDYSYTITKNTKDALIQAIKDGESLASVIRDLDTELNDLSDVSIERYARTKTTEVFNRGRKEYFDSTGVVEAYQFSAILDDVTSETCGELNGLTFPADSAPTPPLHFNCRSVLVPITRFEDWSADGVTNSGKNVDKFLEKNVTDKGFSVFANDAEPEPVVDTPKPARPKITDEGVELVCNRQSNFEQIVYSLNGKPFQETLTIFDEAGKLLSVSHKRLDEPSV